EFCTVWLWPDSRAYLTASCPHKHKQQSDTHTHTHTHTHTRCSAGGLTDLLGLHGGCVLFADAQLRDGHVVQDDVEVLGPLEEIAADHERNLGNTRFTQRGDLTARGGRTL